MRLRTAADFGAAIRHRRRELDLTQAALAERIGVSRQWVVEVERGKPRATLQLVLRALDAMHVVLRLEPECVDAAKGSRQGPRVDLDAIIDAHRGPRRPST